MLQLASLLLTVGLVSPCLAEEFFVAPPSAIDDCPSPCHTLDQYASNSSLLAGYSNISLVFMSGVHNLSQDMQFPGTNVKIEGQSVDPEDTTISFQQQSSIQFSDTVNLQLSNIQLVHGNGDDVLISWNLLTLNAINVTVQHVRICVQNAASINFVNCVFNGSYLRAAVEYNVSINNCLLTSSSTFGLRIDQAHYVSIKSSNFTNNNRDGIFVRRVDSVSIMNSKLSDNAENGVQANDVASTISIENSKFANNVIGGLHVLEADSVLVKSCNLSYNDMAGIFIETANYVSIQNSDLTSNGYGLYIEAFTGNVSIENSVFSKSIDYEGIYVFEANYVSVESSNLTSNNYGGLYVERIHESILIENSKFFDNLADGVFVELANSVTIKNSVYTKNDLDALYVIQASDVSLENVNLTDNFDGISIEQAYSVSVKNSTICDNHYDGLYILGVFNASLENSILTNNGDDGFYIGQADRVSVENTILVDSKIYVTQGNEVSVKNVFFTIHNANEGLTVDESSRVTIRDSTLQTLFEDATSVLECIQVSSILIQNTVFKGMPRVLLVIANAENLLMQNMTLSGPNFRFGLMLSSVRNVTITNSLVTNGQVGIACINSALTIYNTTMNNNDFGVAVSINIDTQLSSIDSSNAVNNTDTLISDSIFSSHKEAAIMLVNTPENTVVIRDCKFTENRGTSIGVYQSTVALEGENIFRDNLVVKGGGLALHNAKVIFSPGSNTVFDNNKASEFGGAIFISTLEIPLPQLFVALENIEEPILRRLFRTNSLLKLSCFHSTSSESHITFTGNTAIQGGWDIYGPTLYSNDCLVRNNPAFTFDENTPPTLQVSSDPSRVCFCLNSTRQCEDGTQLVRNETRYPGESFKVSVTLAGYDYGIVAGLVYANVLGRDYTEVLGDGQHIQDVNLTECAELEYTVFSNTSEKIYLSLTAGEVFTQESNMVEIDEALFNANSPSCTNGTFPCTALLITPIYIRVTLEECPLGFQLNKEGRCECDSTLADRISSTNLTCDIRDRMAYINREGRVWIGVDTRENTTDIYYWHENCPSDYCNSSNVPVTLTRPDVQCSLSRSGMLCGGCQANHSLMLGGNKCSKECSNHSIAWILLFAVFGVLLVVFIKVLDLTVANGTINGLIFYANVVWANRAILFSLQDRLSIGYYIITVPIAWINLDFGIEICFSQDLDQLTKTGLQFVFPVYIWCIAGLIILVSHYSTKVTRLFGRNSVAVLSTLFLLSYGKLVRNITDVFNFADLIDSNNSTRKVWSLDGNVRYGTGGHIALIITALVFLILLLLFTSTLLLVPLLRGISDRQPLHWINTLKPFFDTFYGPFKDKKQHHLWTGILLISRVIILIVFAATSTLIPNLNILLMTMISMLLLMYSASVGLLYKKWTVSFLENSYILNLMILGAAFLFITISGRGYSKLNPVTTTSMCIALFQFSCILIGHLIKQVLSIRKVKAFIDTRQRKIAEGDNNDDMVANPAVAHRPEGANITYQVVEIPKRYDPDDYDPAQYREELFETETKN